jgi:2,3-bisphosphoglycerate-independent phosphoglycerate mutase
LLTARVVMVVVGENKTHDIQTTPPQVKKKKKKSPQTAWRHI